MIDAALFDGPGRPFRLVALPDAEPAAGEAIVRVSLCTVCASDLHTAAGRRPAHTPTVLGHEVVGIVEAVGAGVDVTVGTRVVLGVAAHCGQCFFCARGLPQKCQALRKLGHEAFDPARGPFGGLASHVHLPAGAVMVPVPDDLPDAIAAPAGCAAATAAAVLRAAGNNVDGECVVVFGAGMLGLAAAAMAAAAGATVVACDPDRARVAQALRFGATHAVTDAAELTAIVMDLTKGRGADAALELSGSPAAGAASIDALRIGGVAVWAGGVLPTAAVAVTPERVVRGYLSLVGVHNYAPRDLQAAVDFLASNRTTHPFADLVEAYFPLADVDQAFLTAAAARPVRVGLRPR